MSHRQFLSESAERAVIAIAMVEPHTMDVVGVEPADFYNPARAQIWQQLLTMRAMGQTIDEITVSGRYVEANANLKPEWLACMAHFGSPSLAGDYGEVIRGHALTRRVVACLSECMTTANQGETSGDELLVAAQSKLNQLLGETSGKTKTMRGMIKALAKELDEAYARRAAGEAVIRGIPTGIDTWDDWGGLHRGVVTVLGGRPAMGKTAVAQQITQRAVERGIGVHVFQFEDTSQSYAARALARECRVSVSNIRGARLTTGDMRAISPAMGRLSQWSCFGFEDISTATGAQVVSAVRRERERLGTQLVVVDYLQHMRAPDNKMDDQTAFTSNIQTLAQAAKDDNLSYLVLSQLNRKCESRPDKRPLMSDFRGAGGIEEKAKTCVAVYRPGYYDPNVNDDVMELLVIKNNDGPTGDIECDWHGPSTSVSNRGQR